MWVISILSPNQVSSLVVGDHCPHNAILPGPHLPCRTPLSPRDSLFHLQKRQHSDPFPPPPQLAPSEDSFLSPPARIGPSMNDGNSTSRSRSHQHRHFSHLPHQLNSLAATKMFASAKLSRSRYSWRGIKAPRIHTSPNLEFRSYSNVESAGTAGLPPLVLHIIRPNSSRGQHDQMTVPHQMGMMN
jgi:hypothetical protein